MQTLVKRVVPFTIKAAGKPDPNARTFEGLAAVFAVEDLGNDIIHKGAFKQSLMEWRNGGDAMPLLNSHNQWDIMSALGQMIDAKETPEGLWTKWEVIDGPDGDAVLARLRPSERTGRAVVGKMSIGYEPVKWDMTQNPDARYGETRNLRQVNLKEVSLVMFPMAPGASVDATSVKQVLEWMSTAEVKSLDKNTATDLRRLASRIGLVLKQFKGEEPTPVAPVPPAVPAPVAPEVESESADPAPSPTPAPEGEEADAPEAPAADPAAPTPSTPVAPVADAGKSVYLMGEALQQRLQKTLLKHKTSTVVTQ